jgi:DMSO/TMAO reductase YedYZ molybdopterin-dependent catalytic subunit
VFDGGERIGDVDFVGEDIPRRNTVLGAGWDGRLYFDHTVLSHGSLIVPNELFYVRTLYPDLLRPPSPWVIRARVRDGEAELTLPQLLPLAADQGVHLLECSGNRGAGFGLISAARWGGISVVDVLGQIPFEPTGYVRVSGFDEHSVPSAGGHSIPGASWIFSVDALIAAGAFLATTMNGEPLPANHGSPLRLLVPGWYGCTAIKWVDEIEFVDADAPPTGQMLEFATRTHQPDPVSALAREFRPASLEQSAMPVRVERWRLANGEIAYRIVGVRWGGSVAMAPLEIRIGDADWAPVTLSPATANTWGLWTYAWRPGVLGEHAIRMRAADPNVPQLRLSRDWYVRTVRI